MAIGPVQLIVLGFDQPDFHGEIIDELERLRVSDTIRVIDALAVYKDADGEFAVEHLSNLSAGGSRIADGFISPLPRRDRPGHRRRGRGAARPRDRRCGQHQLTKTRRHDMFASRRVARRTGRRTARRVSRRR